MHRGDGVIAVLGPPRAAKASPLYSETNRLRMGSTHREPEARHVRAVYHAAAAAGQRRLAAELPVEVRKPGDGLHAVTQRHAARVQRNAGWFSGSRIVSGRSANAP